MRNRKDSRFKLMRDEKMKEERKCGECGKTIKVHVDSSDTKDNTEYMCMHCAREQGIIDSLYWKKVNPTRRDSAFKRVKLNPSKR